VGDIKYMYVVLLTEILMQDKITKKLLEEFRPPLDIWPRLLSNDSVTCKTEGTDETVVD
jgi:hypothetical protein